MEHISKDETISLRNKYISKSCQLFFQEDPIKIVSAKAQFMYDEKGEAYLDCINNVAHVGHCHSKVVEAGYNQMKVLSTNNRFLHDNIVLYAKRLIELMPGNLNTCFFVNSGSEANDLALRLAQIHTGNKDIITLEGAYHGHLTSLIDISHYKFSLPGGTGQKDHVYLASSPCTYRGKYNTLDYKLGDIGHLYTEEVKELCERIRSEKGAGVCAFIAESLLCCGGQIIPPPNYLKEVYKHVRANGGVCIADEVQVGFGRVGKHWWAFELHDVIPDIVTLGKPMGNGHPVSAVVTTEEIAESFRKTGVSYFNTFGGNPVSCAIANSVLDVIQEENLMTNATEVGDYLFEECLRLKSRHTSIGDVRGIGLFLGLDFVKNQETRTADPERASIVIRMMKENRILLSVDGPRKNVIKMKPPMMFSKQNVDEFVSTLDRILEQLEQTSSLSKGDKIQNGVEGKV